ncbi:hypothetical protein C8R46DRAFT_330663 [Mycena filopes]|nr:hypothetical protein C8R46DRAFT_330663 [Mycena filopes]
MLAALLLHFIRTSYALPTAERPEASTPDNCLDSMRTVPGIVWSCLTTIFACTWIAVHPNLPNPEERVSRLANFRRRIYIFVIALIVPEYIIAWAVGQFLLARDAVANLREFSPCKDWTLTHGFFITMGGFELADPGGNRLGILDDGNLRHLLKTNRIALPAILSAEIDDKSKGDALGKLLVLTQTTWFMAQVVSRAIQTLPMTELELTTVAFASLNIITYILWWKKPLDVQQPIVVTLLDHSATFQSKEEEISASPVGWVNADTPENSEVSAQPPGGDLKDKETHERTPTEVSSQLEKMDSSVAPAEVLPEDTFSDNPAGIGSQSLLECGASVGGPVPTSPGASLQPASLMPAGDEESVKSITSSPKPGVTTQISRVLLPALYMTVAIMTAGGFETPRGEEMKIYLPPLQGGLETQNVLDSDLYVHLLLNLPPFHRGSWYSYSVYEVVAETMIGALFGAIHCAAWMFNFPTQRERTLWRSISLYITLGPLLLAIVHCLVPYVQQGNRWYRRRTKYQSSPLPRRNVSMFILIRVAITLIILFVIARIATFVCAFVLLRDLPPGTLQEVQWLRFIPHI